MQIVVVGGFPCSGKSKFASALRERRAWPLLSKDDIKERLFDTLGFSNRDWSRAVSNAAYEVMFAQALELARCGVSCIVEGNFRPREHEDRFAALSSAGAQFVQVHCRAQPVALIDRFKHRAESGSRHPGHVDIQSLDEIAAEMQSAAQQPLVLEGELVVCDTTEDWRRAIDAALVATLRLLTP